MGNYHSDQPLQPEFESYSVAHNSNNTEDTNPQIIIDSMENEPNEPSQVMEVSIVEDTESPLQQDWFDLARKLRGQNRELLNTIVKLEQALSASRRELQDYQKRWRDHNGLMSQQTSELQTIQAQNTNLIEKLNLSQREVQQKQNKLEVLLEEVDTLKKAFAKLERECVLLKEEGTQKGNRIILQQRQIDELQQRLQRQQRYSLQYKAALDECLSSNAKKIEAPKLKDHGSVDKKTSPKVVAIQPWSSSSETSKIVDESPSSIEKESQTPSSDPIDQTLEELFSITPNENPTANDQGTSPEISTEPTQDSNTENKKIEDNNLRSSNTLLVSSSVPFSFSIDRHKKEDAAREKVDLPSFLRRQS